MFFTSREKVGVEIKEKDRISYQSLTTGTRKNLTKMRTSHKMYLTFILSSACIFMYQYHVSIPRAFSQQSIIEVASSTSTTTTSMNNNNSSFKATQSANIAENSSTTITSNDDVVAANQLNQNATDNITKHSLTTKQHSQASMQSTQNANDDIYNLPSSFDALNVVASASTVHSLTTKFNPNLPPLYIVTPTYRRLEQLAELTRLGYCLKHVPNLLWMVIEDSELPSPKVTKLLQKINVPFLHLVAPMPAKYKKWGNKPRGVSQRRLAMQWLKANAVDGVFYYADDDNTFDPDLFEQMRWTKKISMFPVGLIGRYRVSSPIVKNGTLVGFYDGWIGGRKYAIDMAGFAVGVSFFLTRNATMPYHPGYEEEGFLKSLEPFEMSEIQLLASNCTETLVWHTQTKKNGIEMPYINATKYNNTNLLQLSASMV